MRSENVDSFIAEYLALTQKYDMFIGYYCGCDCSVEHGYYIVPANEGDEQFFEGVEVIPRYGPPYHRESK